MDLRDELKGTLGNGFTVERELAGGGMSRVFIARDTTLGRDVVVKVLPPDMSAGVSAERFRREIQVAAQLQHPHIVPLLSASASDSLLFYAMPFIAGETLRDRAARGPALSCAESVRIWRELLDALSYAHSRGIVHRDIKPENILLSNRHALVTDFGIARAVAAATAETRMTSTGLALGTPAYMSPEQAAGDRNVDGRADIYSAGLVMYELLGGQPAFTAASAREMVTAQLTRDAPALTPRDPSTPKALVALVMRCLAKDPAARPQSADELLEALDSFGTPSPTAAAGRPNSLRALRAAAVGLVLVSGGLGAWSVRVGHLPFAAPAAPPNSESRLMVFRASNTFEPGDANLGRSFSDAVLSELAKDPWLNVTTPGAVELALQISGYDPGTAPRDTMLKVMKALRSNVYVDLTLSRAGTGYVFSADPKGAVGDNSVGAVSAAANTAADVPAAIQRVATGLRRTLVRSRRALPPTPFAAGAMQAARLAIPAYLEAQSHEDRREFDEAALKAAEAIRIDSTFVMAWRLRSAALGNTIAPNSARLEAISAAYALRDQIQSSAIRLFVVGDYFRFLGRDAEAIAAYDTMSRLMGPIPGGNNNLAAVYRRLRRPSIAAGLYRSMIDTTYQRVGFANANLVGELLKLGRVDDAEAEYRRMHAHADSNDANTRAARFFMATATRNWLALDAAVNNQLRQQGSTARILGLSYAAVAATVRGRVERSDSVQRLRAEDFKAAGDLSDFLSVLVELARTHASMGDTAGARRLIDEGLAKVPWTSLPAVDRPFDSMIKALALIGDTARADAIAGDWAKSKPPQYKMMDSLDVLTARSELALARRNPREALRLLRIADTRGCVACFYPIYARIFDALHLPDSVATYYEKYATATDPGSAISDSHELARAYRRLGEIYEERGDWKRAIHHYQYFVNLWEHADVQLQPSVKDVRARIERLQRKTG